MALFQVIITGCLACIVLSKPLDDTENMNTEIHHMQPRIWKRYINRSLTAGDFADSRSSKLRTKRGSEEDCEKLQLCKLHAQSGHSFFAAYELYFVNKENAKLWDHRARTPADCERRFSACYHQDTPTHEERSRTKLEFVDEDYER